MCNLMESKTWVVAGEESAEGSKNQTPLMVTWSHECWGECVTPADCTGPDRVWPFARVRSG